MDGDTLCECGHPLSLHVEGQMPLGPDDKGCTGDFGFDYCDCQEFKEATTDAAEEPSGGDHN